MGQQMSAKASTQPPPSGRDHWEILLVGGGHANVQVMKLLGERFELMQGSQVASIHQGQSTGYPVRCTLLSDYPLAYYSGMIPGCIAGIYSPKQTQIDLLALSEWCGVHFVKGRFSTIDWESHEVITEEQIRIPFDLVVMNVGSTVRGYDIPGVAQWTIATRPISELLAKIEAFEKQMEVEALKEEQNVAEVCVDKEHESSNLSGFQPDESELHSLKGKRSTSEAPFRVIVVGGGVAGIELAFAFRRRINDRGRNTKICIVHSGKQNLLLDRGESTSENVMKKLRQYDITVYSDTQAINVEEDFITLEDGRTLQYDLCCWTTGAAAHPFLQGSGCTLQDGYILVNRCLQSVSHKNLFAVGDCCHIQGNPVAKAGVYSVREGPVVADNLIRILTGEPVREYVPQPNFLALVNTSDGEAISSWRGSSVCNSWMMMLKDYIDQNFMNLFKPSLLPASKYSNSRKSSGSEGNKNRVQ